MLYFKDDESCQDMQNINLNNYIFDVDLSYIETIPQANTNRCWLISAISEPISRFRKETGLADFKLSLNYITFWDCMEKCELFFDNIIRTSKFEIASQEVQSILQAGIDDGGDWLNAAEIITKYGVVPECSMPETTASSDPEALYAVICRYVKHTASKLRTCKSAEQSFTLKQTALSEIRSYLATNCGEPPIDITVDSCLARALNTGDAKITALQLASRIFSDFFLNQISFVSVDSSFVMPNAKCIFPYNGYRIITPCAEYINIEFESLKEIILKQLLDGKAVPIACDARYSQNMSQRVFDIDSEGHPLAFTPHRNVGFDYRLLRINHSMLVVGVKRISQNKYLWKLANSWAENPNDYYYATDRWFNTFVFEAVIFRQYYSETNLPVQKILPNTIIL